ncbi:SMP-30/gluconolactonase/LRE family protein [Armatimonas sp.]|uniref:SMP-30/gluconolactonase/LRE family protein n=1 Tax=Armatimonas sp. TaxID=1872638 RepID=UPI003751D19B
MNTNSTPSVIAPGAALEKLAGEFSFTEGPAADAKGNVYFTDQPNDRIMLWSLDGKLSTFMQPAGRSNGMFFDKAGSLWSCADENNQLWKIGMDKKVTVVVKSDPDGKLLNGPNDVWVHPKKGGYYFTDPLYVRPYWKRDPARQPAGEYVYFVSADFKTLKAVATDLKKPNGIVGTPDGKTLYVADIGDNKTYSYKIEKDGSLSGKKLHYALGSDGMTLDNEGNLYLTGKGVTVVDKNGQLIENIPVPEGWSANVCFGGRDRKTLFITASKGLYAIKTRTHGVDNP